MYTRVLGGAVCCLMSVLGIAGLFILSGCGSCLGRGPSGGAGQAQSPASPLAAPRGQSPGSPIGRIAQTPGAPKAAQVSAPVELPAPDAPVELTLNTISAVAPGMTYDDVQEMLGLPGVVIAGTDEHNSVYRWSYSGMSFMGRFEEGVLVRKSMMNTQDDFPVAQDASVFEFDRNLFELIQPGMTYDEVMNLIGMDAQPLTSDGDRVTLYKWTDERGSSISGRFENSVLVRKAGMILGTGDEEVEVGQVMPEAAYLDADEEDDAVETARIPPDRYPVAEMVEPPVLERTLPGAPEVAPRAQPQVHVAGSTRRERRIAQDDSPTAGRSYQPVAKLPAITRGLRRGVYEIRIHNTTESRAQAAIIADEGGLELTINGNSVASARVNQGNYQIYFIYDDSPHTLHQGQQIPVAETRSDFSVYLFDNTYSIDFLDRGLDPPGRSR